MRGLDLWRDSSSPRSLFRDIWSALDEFDRGYQNQGQARSHEIERAISPACDVAETEGAYMITLDMPGLKKEELNIEVTGRQLTISGERKREEDVTHGSTHRIERVYGKFFRTFELPEGTTAENIEADYENGVLKLAVPKAEKSKSIKVRIGESSSGKGFLKRLTNKVEPRLVNN